MLTIVNTSAKFSHANVIDSGSVDIGFTPTVGNILIVVIANWTSTSTPGIAGVTDSEGGNSYHEDVEVTRATQFSSTIYSSKVAIASGTFSITVDPSASSGNYIEWGVIEVSGLDATTWLDRIGTNNSAAGDATVTSSGANSTAEGIAVACATISNDDIDINIGDTPPTGFTNLWVNENGNATIGFSGVRKIYSGIETSAASWSHDNTSQTGWTAVIATYKAAAAATEPFAGLVSGVPQRRRDRPTGIEGQSLAGGVLSGGQEAPFFTSIDGKHIRR